MSFNSVKSVNIISNNNDIIKRSSINLLIDGIPFSKLAEECANKIGGTPEDWMKRNKSLLGIFDSKNKKMRIGTRFKVPHFLVEKAIEKYASSTSLSPDTSLFNVTPETSPYSSTFNEPHEFAAALDNSLRKMMEQPHDIEV
ncbi:hypothetical protein BST79_gp293 [Only Syngen Nebraska virus 5]|uniref:hypothetical protein n=1 Tax=Only Syngen Nebraska virus 5 TaxID=1917232 RepID=UPI000901FA23|nr:hypothetical protein BST79_gp293 [Only Syngen Nebraska virus 5]APC25806.1 hypothetical protein [Only Syngen Nebraska virus 5]